MVQHMKKTLQKIQEKLWTNLDVKNLESFINQKGLALLLGNEKVSLKFKGEIEAKAYGIRNVILIDYAIGNIQDLVK